MPNRLAGETSPYLLQHADNPVDWYPWGEEAFERARREDRPVLLSIGYSACHWCHVMAHESFADPEVAATLNRLFVNIKVDREERPDLDQIYQAAQQLLTARPGGWPLTLFLSPDGTPFYGGTYFPKSPRFGLPGFADLCERVADVWRKQRHQAVLAQGDAVRHALAQMAPRAPEGAPALDAGPLDAAAEALRRSFDPHHAGFGRAPKFPHPSNLALLLRRYARNGADDEVRDMALDTLRHMAEGGICDQLGGGFFRYSVDERWEIPHFEKMLYDNGPLLGLCADAWAISGEPLFARVAEETAAWVLREMQSPEGGFHSSLDADTEGEEGGYYVWSRDEARALLAPEEWQVAARCYGFDGPPNFENRLWHLRLAAAPAEAAAPLLASARAKLLAARQQRVRPGCDDKVLTSWNALMIGGLAHAGRILERPEWIAAARRGLDFLRRNLWQPESRRLLATWRAGRGHLDAYLDDYAFLLAAVLELLQEDFRTDELDFARSLADALLERFEDRQAGGFHFTAHDHEQLIARLKPGEDGSTPSGNGVAALALLRLGLLLGDDRYLEAARRTVILFWPILTSQPGACATLLAALDELLRHPATTILRGPAEALAAWRSACARDFRPQALALWLPNGTAGLPPPLARPESPAVNAWVCCGVSCLAPIDNLPKFRETLAAVCTAGEIV